MIQKQCDVTPDIVAGELGGGHVRRCIQPRWNAVGANQFQLAAGFRYAEMR